MLRDFCEILKSLLLSSLITIPLLSFNLKKHRNTLNYRAIIYCFQTEFMLWTDPPSSVSRRTAAGRPVFASFRRDKRDKVPHPIT